MYLVAGPTRLRTRLLQLGAALAAVVVAAGWYIALVELWPAADRPYIGGSTTNSLLELALGYNGIGRLLGGSGNGGGGGPGGSGNAAFGGSAGITRLFTGEIALEASWLLPAALVLLVAGLAVTMQAPRTDRLRAALLLWGGWTLVTGVVFSFMSGTMHPYYTVALAPGIAALVGVGAVAFWRQRAGVVGRLTLALAAAVTAAWAFVLLAQSDEAFAWVRWVVLAAGVVAVACLVPAGRLRRVALAGAAAAVLVGLAAPAAYAVTTATTAHSGSIPSVGTSASAMGGGTGGGPGDRGTPPWQTDAAASGSATTGGATTDAAATSGAATTDDVATGGTAAASQGGTPPGGMGGVTSAELTALLTGTTSTWSAAVSSAQSAAGLELASGTAVMSTGGWSGSDAAVTPAQFQAAVANGEIHYYYIGGGPGESSDGTSAQIAAWVAANYPATTVGGQTVYDLTA